MSRSYPGWREVILVNEKLHFWSYEMKNVLRNPGQIAFRSSLRGVVIKRVRVSDIQLYLHIICVFRTISITGITQLFFQIFHHVS
jgi:hypothetical protein